MRGWFGCLAALGAFSIAAGARAEDRSNDWDGGYDVKSERRSDFTLGVSSGFAFGTATGYPREVDKIDEPEYRSTTDLGTGQVTAVWLGVAFNDYLTFGLGGSGYNLSGNGQKASGGGFLLHVDTYPLFAVSPALRDLGVFANFGAGGLTIEGGPEKADGGTMSSLEAGLTYERLRLWKIAFGPTLSFLHLWSESGTVSVGLLGARASFYGGPS